MECSENIVANAARKRGKDSWQSDEETTQDYFSDVKQKSIQSLVQQPPADFGMNPLQSPFKLFEVQRAPLATKQAPDSVKNELAQLGSPNAPLAIKKKKKARSKQYIEDYKSRAKKYPCLYCKRTFAKA